MPLGFRPAAPADLPWLLDLSIRVLRADLERVGRFDPARREARLRETLARGGLLIILSEGEPAGCAQALAHPDHLEIAAFYLEPATQGRGLGRAALSALLAGAPGLPARIEVLKGSPARLFWERMGFRQAGETAVDWLMERPPGP